jgi:hypothetical protein
VLRIQPRLRAGLTVLGVATIAALGPFGVASGTTVKAPLPTLSGESFHQDTPTITSAVCRVQEGNFTSEFTYRTTGTASGPYPGTYTETGRASIILPQYDLSSRFTIDSPVGRVTGTSHSTNFGISCGGGGCSSVADCRYYSGAAFNTDIFGFSGNDTYQATITTADGTFADHGLFRAVFYRAGDNPLNRFDESFLSALNAPTPLAPTTTNQCKHGGWKQFGFKNQGQCVAFVQRGPGP